MESLMHQVAKFWYRLYWGVMVAASLGIVAAYITTRSVSSLQETGENFGLSTAGVVLTVLHLIFCLTAYWWLQRRTQTIATMTASMLLTLMLLFFLNRTGFGAYGTPYIIAWLVTGFFSSMYGTSIGIGTIFLTGSFVLLMGDFRIHTIGNGGWALIIGNALAVGAGYLFWRPRFVDMQSQKLSQLSGMLRSNRQQSEILIESIADGIIVVNTEGKITLMNPAAAKMTEWPVNEASGVEVQMVVKLNHEKGAAAPLEESPFLEVLRKKQRSEQILQLSGRDGKKLIISLVVSPVILQGSNAPVGAVAVMRDVSEQRAVEQQRADFISTAAHEMRTPVAAIEGYLALALNEKVSTIDSRARGYLEKAHSSTQHLGKLFQDLLTSSKAEDGRLSNHPVVVEMGAFMQQLTDDLKFTAEKKGLFAEFIVGAAEETVDATAKDAAAQHMVKPLYYVQVDPDRMREVVTNLFDNAVKYTEQGKISIGLTGDTDVVQIYVRDTGPGIPAEDLPHLFQKFYRVDSSATRTIGGTGLGLFICRKIVELYKGRIWVDSDLGKGSTFFINLPRLTAQRASDLQAAEASQTPAAASGTSLKQSVVQ